jgi:hypothetical protein
MENVEAGAAYYCARAAEMRAKADEAQTEELRASFLTLEASWLRLAEAAKKSETDADPEDAAAP